MPFSGLHHVTGITGDAQTNVDFYVGLLGLRLVKRTVNHNDAFTLHLFYGDAVGSPGSLLTFFVWPDAARGRFGAGQFGDVGLMVPRERIGDWVQRLLSRGVPFGGPTQVGDSSRLTLTDPDGLAVEIVGVADAPEGHPWAKSSVPAAMQIRALHHVTLWTEQVAASGSALETHLGLTRRATRDGLALFGSDGACQTMVLRDVHGFWPGAEGAGVIHHVAFRAHDDDALAATLASVTEAGLDVSRVRDHGYFKSIYFREPGGSLIEMATDRPGLALDEPHDPLGEQLALLPELESRRKEIENTLPTLTIPGEPGAQQPGLSFIHRFERDAGPLTLLLLHGTGADETQLLDIGRHLAPGAHRLGVRGRSLEEGSPRFFRRYTAVTYDQAHLLSEAEALTAFVQEAAQVYGLAVDQFVAVGYSNGANIALTAASHWPASFKGAILFRPVMVMEQPPDHDLAGLPVLMLEGKLDPFLPFGESVEPYLVQHGARVQRQRLEAGHELTSTDIKLATDWLQASGL